MIYRPRDTFDLVLDEGPELHDLTGRHGCSLLPVAGELREREAARKARAARRSRSWLRRAGAWLRGVARRGERAPAGRTASRACLGCETGRPGPGDVLCPACQEIDREEAQLAIRRELALMPPEELLAVARAAAARDGRKELTTAIHALMLLDLTGNLAEMAPLVASVRRLQSALGDDLASVN